MKHVFPTTTTALAGQKTRAPARFGLGPMIRWHGRPGASGLRRPRGGRRPESTKCRTAGGALGHREVKYLSFFGVPSIWRKGEVLFSSLFLSSFLGAGGAFVWAALPLWSCSCVASHLSLSGAGEKVHCSDFCVFFVGGSLLVDLKKRGKPNPFWGRNLFRHIKVNAGSEKASLACFTAQVVLGSNSRWSRNMVSWSRPVVYTDLGVGCFRAVPSNYHFPELPEAGKAHSFWVAELQEEKHNPRSPSKKIAAPGVPGVPISFAQARRGRWVCLFLKGTPTPLLPPK